MMSAAGGFEPPTLGSTRLSYATTDARIIP